MLSFTLTQWSMWSPASGTLGSDQIQDSDKVVDIVADLVDRATKPNVKDLPMMLRRRLSRFGRMAMRVALDSGATDEVRLVFSSRYGDAVQTAGLLTDLSHQEPVSPAVFSMLVHNALAGLFCIHNKNRHPHTAIAAGDESFCAGLLESAVLLAEEPQIPVLLIYCDEPLPEIYDGYAESDTPSVALALLLTAKPGDNGHQFGFTANDQKAAVGQSDPAISFVDFLRGQADGWSWSSNSKTWWCRRDVK